MQPRILMRVLCVMGLSLAALGCSTSSDPTETSQIPTEPAAGDCETTGCSANEVCVVEGSEPECLCDDGFHRDLSGSCISDATLTSCTSSGVDCTEGQPSETDASCDPVDGCVYSCLPDTCVVDGQCIPSGVVAPDNPCLSCQPDIDREAYTVLSGATCDDGDVCTYGDRCGGQGICTGTPITCEDDAEQCGASKSCNGTDTCTVTYPPLGTSCNDGELCTFDDACDGQGACMVRRSCVKMTSEPVGRQEHATAQVIARWRFQGRKLSAMTMTSAHSAMRAMERVDVLGRRLSAKTRIRFAVLSPHATARVPVA